MAESLNWSFKNGKVVEVDGKTCRARVEFTDEDAVVSPWLSVPQDGTGGAKHYKMPKVGAIVSCQLDENGENGSIVGASYSEDNPPPFTDPNIQGVKYDDGGEDSYDTSSGKRTIKAPNGLDMQAGGASFSSSGDGMKMTAPKGMNIEANGVNFEIRDGWVFINGQRVRTG
jgi:phage baseplate assembly protein V